MEITNTERFFFDNNGYLVLESFLAPEHVAQLTTALFQATARRRDMQRQGELPHIYESHFDGDNSRLFHILGDDPLFLQLLDWPPLMPYVQALLNQRPHHHASDAIIEVDKRQRAPGWHIDGHDDGYRGLGWPIPLLQLKVGYYLSDMTAPGQGNLYIVPGSHKARSLPPMEELNRTDPFPGALQVCAPPGSVILFHNALWHSHGPWTQESGKRIMLYYAYEHPWMIASQEHWCYSQEFYNSLGPERRKFFHGFLFDPPEQRWG